MRMTRRLLIIAFGLLVLVPSPAAAQGDRPLNAYWYCYSQPDQDPVYVSAVWDAREIQDAIASEFQKSLAARHNYKGSVNCAGASKAYAQNTLAKTESDFKQQQAGWQKAGRKIVQTGWTGKEPAAGSAPVHWATCVAGILAADGRIGRGPYQTYLSAPFDGGDNIPQTLQAAFKTFLIAKYNITTTDLNPSCEFAEDQAKALAVLKLRSDRGQPNGKVIDTGWTFPK
jgi:hypothetical protein